ncbi:MAG TPA: FliM/FliN family flagellar motor switch protein [Gaiellaceae bacterium]
MTTEEALLQLAESTGEAVAGVLGMFCGDGVERGTATVVTEADPLHAIPVPAVATNVSYVDGVTGGNVFVVGVAAGRKLAAAMMGEDPTAVDGDATELSELELSAVSEAANQMMAAAAGATSSVLGEEVEISVPETRFLESLEAAEGMYEKTPHATTVSFTVFGEPCRLVQLVPNAFTVKMTRAFSDRAAELLPDEPIAGAVDSEAVRDIPVRVWAELGRSRMPVARAVGLAPGAVVELDREVEEPVDLFVNGRRFALGRLLLVDGEWAVQVEEILNPSSSQQVMQEGGS